MDYNRKTLNIYFLCLIFYIHWPRIPFGSQGERMLYYTCSAETRHQRNPLQVVCNYSFSSGTGIIPGTFLPAFVAPLANCSHICFSVPPMHILFHLLFIEKQQRFLTWRLRFLNYWIVLAGKLGEICQLFPCFQRKNWSRPPQGGLSLMEGHTSCFCGIYNTESLHQYQRLA